MAAGPATGPAGVAPDRPPNSEIVDFRIEAGRTGASPGCELLAGSMAGLIAESVECFLGGPRGDGTRLASPRRSNNQLLER
jgi:hypothetical protein